MSKERVEVMTHEMKCVSGKVLIGEMEEMDQLKGVAIFLSGLSGDWPMPILFDKQELHRFIGVLLHIQAKMK